MKLFRFIKRYKNSDWLEVIRADSLKEAVSLYDYNDSDYEVEEMPERKGCILAFHITPRQGKY